MTEQEPPAERLRSAADAIENLAAGAAPGPWRPVEWYTDCLIVADREGKGIATESSTGDVAMGDARWIAALGPQLAAPLAAWLRDAEQAIRHDVPVENFRRALAVADAILGGTR